MATGRFTFDHRKKKRTAWVEVDGARVAWAEGPSDSAPPQQQETCATPSLAAKKRDQLVGKWLAAGFEVAVGRPRPGKPLLADLRARARELEAHGGRGADQAHRAILESVFEDAADEITSSLSAVWRDGSIEEASFDVDPSFVETLARKQLRPLLASSACDRVTSVAFELPADAQWWDKHVRLLLRELAESPRAGQVKSLRFATRGHEDVHGVQELAVLPDAAFANLRSLEDLRLDGGLTTVSGGPSLRGLVRLTRKMGEISREELGALSAGRFDALAELAVESEYVVLSSRDTEPEAEDVASLRRETTAFTSGAAFPALRRLVLRVPRIWDTLAGGLRAGFEHSGFAARLESLELTIVDA